MSVAGRDCTMPPGTRRFACSPFTLPSNFTPALPTLDAKASASAGDQIEGATITAGLVMNDGSEWLWHSRAWCVGARSGDTRLSDSS